MMNENIIHWQVWDPLFNKEEAWPKEEFPDATLRYMREAGCMVTAVATMLRLYGIEKEDDPEKFNPWIFCRTLKQYKTFTLGADLILEAIKDLYPLCFMGVYDYSKEKLADFLAGGDPCMVMVDGVHSQYHFVVPVKVTEDDVEIIDSGWDKPYLSGFSHKYHIYRFCRLEKMSAGVQKKEALIQTAFSYLGVQVTGPDFPWCVAFEWDVFRKSGLSELFYDGNKTASCRELYEWAKRTGRLVDPEKGQRGDIALYDWYGENKPVHTGIVLNVLCENHYRTIEGNTCDVCEENACKRVMVQSRRLGGIFAMIRPDYGR